MRTTLIPTPGWQWPTTWALDHSVFNARTTEFARKATAHLRPTITTPPAIPDTARGRTRRRAVAIPAIHDDPITPTTDDTILTTQDDEAFLAYLAATLQDAAHDDTLPQEMTDD